ncbi:hypothetical protein [Bradyrhizobium guangdongense]|uniref:Uncharacterized protein n=1 Tax=Bradyrhizobium guangdongense TaxID=1325090 RepID=A0AA87WEX7_9BRAD|nr:hypothetical protein [Bradyrhizobium guangdongense]GGI31738.1 hypothetical protein GCM10010987_65910 [Bradyrhizobium guangdongense]
MTNKTTNSEANGPSKEHFNPRYLRPCADYFAKNPEASVRIVARRRIGRDWVNLTFYGRDGGVFELLGEQVANLIAGPLGCGTALERLTGIYELVRSQDCRPSPSPATRRYAHG